MFSSLGKGNDHVEATSDYAFALGHMPSLRVLTAAVSVRMGWFHGVPSPSETMLRPNVCFLEPAQHFWIRFFHVFGRLEFEVAVQLAGTNYVSTL